MAESVAIAAAVVVAETVNSIRLAIEYRCQEALAAFNGQANAQQTLKCVKMEKKFLSSTI